MLEVEVGAAVRQEQAELISPSLQSAPSPFGNGMSKRSNNSQNSVGSGTSAVFVNVLKQLAVLQPSGSVGDRLATPCWSSPRTCKGAISRGFSMTSRSRTDPINRHVGVRVSSDRGQDDRRCGETEGPNIRHCDELASRKGESEILAVSRS